MTDVSANIQTKDSYNSNYNPNFHSNTNNKYTQNSNKLNNRFQPNKNNTFNNANNTKPNKRCYRCGKMGHMSFECYKHPKMQNKDQHKMQTVKNTGEQNNDCYQKVKVDDVELDSFVDLDSDCTTIQASVVDKLNWVYEKSKVVLKGFGGGSYETFGSLNKVIEINDVKLMTNLTVVDDSFQDVSILVGRNFLNHPSVMVIKRFGTLIIKKDCTAEVANSNMNHVQSTEMMFIKKQIELEDVNFGDEANTVEKNLLVNILNQHRDAVALNINELGKAKYIKIEINLKSDEIIRYKPYRLPYGQVEILDGIIKELLQNDIIEESKSEYASPILLVKKKEGNYRMCADYRFINNITKRENFLILKNRLTHLLDREYLIPLI